MSDEPDPLAACPSSRCCRLFDGATGGGLGTLLRLLKPLRERAVADAVARL